MELIKEYCYGRCETCKNCSNDRFGILTCNKSGKLKRWDNKCCLYKVKRKYIK